MQRTGPTADPATSTLAQLGGRRVAHGSPDYPALLATLDRPPPELDVIGPLADLDPAVAIVGARRAGPEGRRIARTLARSLAELGIPVVSGLARGIDGQAHEGALDGGGRTVAVLGSGLDRVYPPEHRGLARRIVAGGGALMSQFPLGARPLKHHFPQRNLVIAGLVRAVVVVEAAERSGSLITARLAADCNRAVLAVPGSPLSSAHRGSNLLIRDGVRPCLELRDVIEELPAELLPRWRAAAAGDDGSSPPGATTALSANARAVYEALSPSEPTHADLVATRTAQSAAAVTVALLQLEMSGLAAHTSGGGYVRLRPTGRMERTSTSLPRAVDTDE